ncbi:putative MFS family arabinose efflux permease [Humibacillus xanthopallidus]|uniref:Putative MFS family arabinose efflux permease n=1 Tax=Humibacillus xanthopallidus TaxID=412689 RepID=A0A543PRJ6_9MICO|nr:MFS transporter [Humibacillus xanthopallidus]TQN46698.1 putative MFS family arabinose efflux permease [Humibacillus xanthopallidus]
MSAEHGYAVLSPAAARRVFLTLSFTRWFPVGLVVGLLTLWQLERGLSVAQSLTVSSAAGLTVFFLELPTSGFADAFGRRPVFITAAAVNVASSAVLIVAQSFWAFLAAAVLTGVFRALDSGPLEAWFVDTVHASTPGADVDGSLAAQGTVLGSSIAAGALVSGALVWWHPFTGASALLLPVVVFVVLNVVHLVATVALLKEPRPRADSSGLRRATASAKEAPAVVRDGLGLLRSNRVLRGIIVVEVFWSVAMIVFETFQPIRLAELVGGEERAGAIMGPVAAGGWAVFAVGAALAGWTSRRVGVARTAILARVLNGLGALVMGLVAGPAALIAAYSVTYLLHGSGGPMHAALLHREARAGNRATVLSMNSMVAFAAFGVCAPLLGLLAEQTSTQVAMVAAGAVSIVGALFYLPARRAERKHAVLPRTSGAVIPVE